MSGAAARRMPVPILMYHVISKAPAGAPNAELWVDERDFADEMKALRAAKYTAVTLAQVWNAWRHGGPLPKRPVVVSFDDGYLSHYTHARPVLRALGWPGVLNLELKAIGAGGLSEHQMRSLIKAGWEIDSHTLTHPDLTTLDDAALAHELVESRRELRERFGGRPTSSPIRRGATTSGSRPPRGPRATRQRRPSTRGSRAAATTRSRSSASA